MDSFFYLLKIDCNKFLVLHVQCMKTPMCDILCYVSTCKCSWLYVLNENYDGAFWCFDNSVEEIKFM